jgi:fucose permease
MAVGDKFRLVLVSGGWISDREPTRDAVFRRVPTHPSIMSGKSTTAPVVPRAMLVPFILITILFPLWGFANDITNPMVAAFKNILLLTNFESSLVQAAFYGGYALMAIPAAIFIKKFSYKSGILIGLALYSIGCLLFIPSGWSLTFAPFLLAYLIMTCGLSFLETTANPYVLSMGDESTATRRLNLAQAFNPMGSIIGMFVASMVILVNLNGTSENARRAMRAASEGVPVHTQVVSQQLEAVKNLESIVADKSFASKMRLRKKAMEESRALSQNLGLLADPQPELAADLAKQIAAQPSENKFAAAAKAVAIVLQLRDRVTPTEAEARRDSIFHGPGGLELALMLGKEQPLLAESPAFASAGAALATATPAAANVATILETFYQEKPNSGLVPLVSAGLSGIRASLETAHSGLRSIPAAAFTAHAAESGAAFKKIQKSDLDIIVGPYALMGGILVVILALFAWKLPHDISHEGDNQLHLAATLKRLFHNGHYLWGVVAQTFYVGAQIMCWTFIIQYAELELGISKATAQNLNILAMVIFVSSRFICTFVLHYVKPGVLLGVLAIGGMILTAGTIFIHGYGGLYSLIGVSACMSLMFPTIYGIALDGLGDDAKLGSAGLILAIGGGCLMPPLQAAIIDLPPVNLGFMELASVRASFALPLVCFAVIAFYGFWSRRERVRV